MVPGDTEIGHQEMYNFQLLRSQDPIILNSNVEQIISSGNLSLLSFRKEIKNNNNKRGDTQALSLWKVIHIANLR